MNEWMNEWMNEMFMNILARKNIWLSGVKQRQLFKKYNGRNNIKI